MLCQMLKKGRHLWQLLFQNIAGFQQSFYLLYCGKNGHFNISIFVICCCGTEVFVRLVSILQQLHNKLLPLQTVPQDVKNKPVPMAMVGDKREGRRTLDALWAVLPELCCIFIITIKKFIFL